MSQTLLIHHDKSVVDLLNLNLSIYVGTDLIVKSDFKEAQLLIEHHPGIHLIVCADSIGDESTAESVVRFTTGRNQHIPIIILGEKSKVPAGPLVTILAGGADLKLILQAAAKYLKVTPKKMIEQIVPDFFPIGINFFLNIKKTPCTLYFLTGENKYQKKFLDGESINSKEIQALIDAGHTQIYVDAPNRLKLVNHVSTDIIGRLKNALATPDEKVRAAEEAIMVVQDEAIKGGNPASDSVQELTAVAIKTCLDIAKNNPTIAGLIKKLFANRTSYLYRHTQLIVYITQHIVSKVEWGSQEQKEKLAFVAFFHDICLTDDKLAKFSSDYAVAADESLTMAEKETITKHARSSAELIQKFPMAPIGSDAIIMQHHGTINGQGFAKAFTNSISPLAIVFIIAEELAHMILELPSPEDATNHKAEMIERLNSKYNRSKYQKIIETLDSISF